MTRPAPAAPPAPPPPASASLDLDEPAPATGGAPVPARPVVSAGPVVPSASVAAGRRLVLSPDEPVMTLSRVQSGIGTLLVEAAVSDAVGDLRLGCAYELRSGLSSIVPAGSRFAPPGSPRPVLVAGHDRYQRIGVDLRQVGELRRLAVFVYSESRRSLTWGGTLIVTTFSGARVEVPLESLAAGQVAVALTAYNVRGRLVLRAELETVAGSVREAAHAYGFDRIAWLDDRTPVE